jgi:hypothetical protein
VIGIKEPPKPSIQLAGDGVGIDIERLGLGVVGLDLDGGDVVGEQQDLVDVQLVGVDIAITTSPAVAGPAPSTKTVSPNGHRPDGWTANRNP